MAPPEQILCFPNKYFRLENQKGQLFFRPLRFVIHDGRGNLMELVEQVVRNSCDALPLPLIKYGLGTFFEVKKLVRKDLF